MKLFYQGLLTLLISLFLLPSCKITNTDLVVDNNNEIKGTLVDTVSLYTRTINDQEAFTGGLSLYPLGFVSDSNFGTIDATISGSVSTPANAYSFGKDPILDSAILVLALSPNYYGDTTKQYTVEVKQLEKTLAEDGNYKSSAIHATKPEVLGTYTGVIFPKTTKKVLQLKSGGAKDTATVFPQLRITLNKEQAAALFTKAGDTNLATISSFNNYLKGLQISIKNKQTQGDFGTYFISFASGGTTYSGVELTYRNTNTEKNKQDTIRTIFPISSSFSDVASTVSRNYDNSALKTVLNASFSKERTVYLQPMSGTLMELKSPNLDFIKKLGTVIINQAELVLPISNGSDVLPFTPSPFLFIYTLDKADQKSLLADGQLVQLSSGFGPNPGLGGTYNSDKKTYTFNITQHIQNIISNKTISKNLYIGQVYPLVSTNTNGSAPSINGIVSTFSSGNTSIIASNKDGMKLKIYYTIVSSK